MTWFGVSRQGSSGRASVAVAQPVANTTAVPPKLKRRLTQRQLTMMTIGGAIGVGLFLGSSVTIRLAGPGVILSYLFSAVIAVIVAYSIAEMAVVHPVAGSFGVYAQTYLNEWSGFAVRATYAFVQIIAIGAEVTAVAIYFSIWFPATPQWVWVIGVSVCLIAINVMQVGNFAEFEYWFAIIKVIAIVAFIFVGLGLIFGLGPVSAVGFSNLISHGGFLPHGMKGVWLAMTLTLTSYMGVEIIGVTAGEAAQPEKTIPRAMRTVSLRLILFYMLSMIVMLSMTPWDRMGSGINGSPFVFAFAAVGIPFAGSIMNLVVITAALSSANTNLYLTTRTLFSLSRDGYVRLSALLRRPRREEIWRSLLSSARVHWRNGSRHTARYLCTRTSLPAALRCRGRRHVLRVDRCPAGTHFFPPLVGPRARRSATDPPAVLALFADCRPDSSRRHHDQHLLCGGSAIYGPELRAVPPGDHGFLLDVEANKPQQTQGQRRSRFFNISKRLATSLR